MTYMSKRVMKLVVEEYETTNSILRGQQQSMIFKQGKIVVSSRSRGMTPTFNVTTDTYQNHGK